MPKNQNPPTFDPNYSQHPLSSIAPTAQALEQATILFSRLGAIYRNLWIDGFQSIEELNAVKTEWAKQLDRISPIQIESAIQACIDSGNRFPPNLPEFVRYATTAPEPLPKSRRKIYE